MHSDMQQPVCCFYSFVFFAAEDLFAEEARFAAVFSADGASVFGFLVLRFGFSGTGSNTTAQRHGT